MTSDQLVSHPSRARVGQAQPLEQRVFAVFVLDQQPRLLQIPFLLLLRQRVEQSQLTAVRAHKLLQRDAEPPDRYIRDRAPVDLVERRHDRPERIGRAFQPVTAPGGGQSVFAVTDRQRDAPREQPVVRHLQHKPVDHLAQHDIGVIARVIGKEDLAVGKRLRFRLIGVDSRDRFAFAAPGVVEQVPRVDAEGLLQHRGR